MGDDSEFVRQYGPDELLRRYKSSDKETYDKLKVVINALYHKRTREFLEPLGGSEQCKAVLEGKTQNSRCWLCGFTIQELGDMLFSQNSSQAIWTPPNKNTNAINAPECEHILPIAVAIQYFDIVANPGSELTDEEKAYFSLNYRWSHRRCNTLKTNKLFLKIIRKDGVYPNRIDVFTDEIAQYVVDLFLLFRKKFNVDFGKKSPSWMAERVMDIINNVVPLMNHLNAKFENRGLLDQLAKSADRREDVFHLYSQIMLKNNTFEAISQIPPPVVEELVKAPVIDEESEEIEGVTDEERMAVASLMKMGRLGGKRKTFKRRNNGVSGRSKKHTYRATAHPHRKRRTSNRGRVNPRPTENKGNEGRKSLSTELVIIGQGRT